MFFQKPGYLYTKASGGFYKKKEFAFVVSMQLAMTAALWSKYMTFFFAKKSNSLTLCNSRSYMCYLLFFGNVQQSAENSNGWVPNLYLIQNSQVCGDFFRRVFQIIQRPDASAFFEIDAYSLKGEIVTLKTQQRKFKQSTNFEFNSLNCCIHICVDFDLTFS